MAQIECGRGHLYDPEKYATCPYCKNNQQITVAAAGRTAPIRVTDAGRTAPLSSTPVTAPQRTAPLTPPPQPTAPGGAIPVTADSKTMPPKGYAPQGTIPVTAPQKTMPPRGYAPPAPAPAPEPTAPPKFHGPSVLDAGKTVGMMQEQMGFDPVVGWLACVEGPSRGKSYTVRGGHQRHRPGRPDGHHHHRRPDHLHGETTPRSATATGTTGSTCCPATGGTSSTSTGRRCSPPRPLQAYDLIDFGETKLLFIPLCGERFTWKKEERDAHGDV